MPPWVEAWLRQAENDLAMAIYAADVGFHAQACSHAGQAAQQALKGILISLDREPRQIHSLERQVSSLTSAGVPTEALGACASIPRVGRGYIGRLFLQESFQ